MMDTNTLLATAFCFAAMYIFWKEPKFFEVIYKLGLIAGGVVVAGSCILLLLGFSGLLR